MNRLLTRLDSWLRFPRGRFVEEETPGMFVEVLGEKSPGEVVLRRVPYHEALMLFELQRYLRETGR